MPQSLAQLHVHLVFSTKNRSRVLSEHIRDPLHRYFAEVLSDNSCHAALINSVEDHVHLLFELGRTVSISEVVQHIKTSSSKWLKTKDAEFKSFAWQSGYAAFAVVANDVRSVRDYVANQRDHHRVESFQDEYRRLLTAHGVEYDERYMWD